ncbi:uncharacterized protein A1O9_00737 [Exophiala aquamarina CBS 119918]|uniref:C2 domain-containing protein n=1 Tax=Exophiala aquamarina CBS 119918 TaxID=1182545 RepID=A0A072PRT6_9EURO|nr:uncharacterized protein A1O9_00737 [Exophiala aquamarina CBS 119918]KEF62764.1 hypothetical protein A1O9_00737 [Exophiala aquamarina CBS 119918]
MSQDDDFDTEASRRRYKAPYTAHHPIPTIQKYKAERSELEGQQKQAEKAQKDEDDDPTVKRAYHAAKDILKGEDGGAPHSGHDPYRTENRNMQSAGQRDHADADGHADGDAESDAQSRSRSTSQQQPASFPEGKVDDRGGGDSSSKKSEKKQGKKSATEAVAGHHDPRQKRKDMKHMARDDGGREVTDPVTHLPIVIRDSTHKDLKSAPENIVASGNVPRTSTGLSGATKSDDQLQSEQSEFQQSHDGMQKLFPPPSFEDLKLELSRTYQLALTVGLGSVVLLVSLALTAVQGFGLDFSRSDHSTSFLYSVIPAVAILSTSVGIGFAVVVATRSWLGKKVEEVWKDEVWDAARSKELEANHSNTIVPESVAWLNNLLAAVWPLINPDLFASISDMLEDVMQASLPKVVRMVSVDDLGQGSESFRILGVNWLPTGAASQSVDSDGELKDAGNEGDDNDRATAGQGQIDNDASEANGDNEDASKDSKLDKQQKEQEQQAIREGMEAEQGDFVNMELAFAYRARSSGKSIQAKAKNAHLYLKFYLPGGIAVPVWVELRGIIGTMRLRLQLTPDPPFFSLCTLSFMGQPQADLSCIPLSRHALNLMDVPLISSFVQSSIDAALAEYVAPKSLTLNLKDMLVGDDFKKDTITRGVVMIHIKSASGFKEGDGGIGPFRGSSDSYMTVSWGKFGKPVASTRVIVDDQEPSWHEWAHILVTPEELNAGEKLRLQLWDSDKYSADDDLGRVEVDLRELMYGNDTKNKMCDREDRFVGEDPDEKMPGSVQWSVGYFEKTKITEGQLAKQTEDPNIRTIEELKKQVSESAEHKLREATAQDESKEIKQQKQEDYKEREDALIISSPPPNDHLSGIFSIQIHNITGLEVESLQKKDKKHTEGNREDEAEQSDDLPSSYATIILNHQKIYRTRTKPKNAKPFFNAGTERFIANWQTAEVMISVRDDREKEDDALLGIVYLPLRRVFEKRSQIMQSYPLVGGIGYGRARVSMVWRSVDLQLPKELLGWNYGTLEVKCPVRGKSTDNNAGGESLMQHRIKVRTTLMRAKMQPAAVEGHDSTVSEWKPKRDKESIFLAVRKRYASPLIIEFRKSSLGPDSTPAFAVFWLKDIPDEEEKTVTVKIWNGGKENIKRATSSYGYEGFEENEKPLGEIDLTLKFWRGLSGYHKRYANKGRNSDVRNVMEVLDTANDEGQVENGDDAEGTEGSDSDFSSSRSSSQSTSRRDRKLRTHTNDTSSGIDSDDAGESEHPSKKLAKTPLKTAKDTITSLADVDGHNDASDGERGARAQVRDYKDHHKQLHRKHRGVMQWKGARTLDWMAGRVKRSKDRVGDLFHHGDDAKAGGIETEV